MRKLEALIKEAVFYQRKELDNAIAHTFEVPGRGIRTVLQGGLRAIGKKREIDIAKKRESGIQKMPYKIPPNGRREKPVNMPYKIPKNKHEPKYTLLKK
jgi:hypothetical protein